MQIIPAIIPESLSDLESHLSLVKNLVKTVQIDICDGKFVPTQTWPYWKGKYSDDFQMILKEENGLPFWQKLDFELDLMVLNPEEIVDDWIIAGASTIIFHAESIKTAEQFDKLKNALNGRAKLGVAINPSTPTNNILPYLEDVGRVQLMGNDKIGFNGVELDEKIYDKIRQFHNNHPGHEISVDIGVNLENAPILIREGVTHLVSGSSIFQSDNIIQTIQEFKILA